MSWLSPAPQRVGQFLGRDVREGVGGLGAGGEPQRGVRAEPAHKGPADTVAGFEQAGQGCACNAIVHGFSVLCRGSGGWGGFGDRPASPLPRCFLAAGEACGAVADGGLSTRRARGGKFLGGNQRRRSAGGTFPAPQAPERTEGLDGPERTRTIRRTAAKKRRRQQQGQGRRSSATAGTGPNSRPRQRTPEWVRALRAPFCVG